MMNTWVLPLIESADDKDQLAIELPQELCDLWGIKPGDRIVWSQDAEQRWIITKGE